MLLAQKEKERAEGLAGRRVGKHVVPEKVTDVQLTSELSESLRALQVRPGDLGYQEQGADGLFDHASPRVTSSRIGF